MRRTLRSLCTVLVAAIAAAGCNETPVSVNAPESIVLSTSALTLVVGEFATVDAQVVMSDGSVLAGGDQVWSSDNDRVVQVSGSFGSLEGIAAGSANVTVTHGALTATVSVTVIGAASLEIFPRAVQMVATGSGQEVTIRALGANGEELQFSTSTTGTPGNIVRWHTLDQAVAAVGSFGTTEFLSPRGVGTTMLVAEALGASDTIAVQVVGDDRGLVTVLDIFADTMTVDMAAGFAGVLTSFSALDGDGDETCTFAPAVALRFDASILGGGTGFAGPGCQVAASAIAAGESWLVLETNRAADSVYVIATNRAFGATFTTVPTTLTAGSTVTYEVTVADKNGVAGTGVPIHFDVIDLTGGARNPGTLSNGVSSAPGAEAAAQAVVVSTGPNGQASVDWTLPTGAAGGGYTLRFSAQFPGGGTVTNTTAGIGAQTVTPDVAADLLVIDATGGTINNTLGVGEVLDVRLGFPLAPTFLIQSVDQFGNHLPATTVTTQVGDPSLVTPAGLPGACPGACGGFTTPVAFTFTAPDEGSESFTISEGSASRSIDINATVETRAVLKTGGIIVAGQADYASGLTDVTVYDGASGTPDLPVFTVRRDSVAFIWDDGGPGRDIAVVAIDGSNATAPIGQLPDDNEPSAFFGYPVFQTHIGGAGAQAGDLLYLSDRDAAKVAAGDTQWDLYRLDRSSGSITKITATSPDSSFIRYFGLSLSPDESRVLVTSLGTDPDGAGGIPFRFAQVYEINVTTGAFTQLTSNTSMTTQFTYAIYSPDGSTIYVESNTSTGLLSMPAGGGPFQTIGGGVDSQNGMSFDHNDASRFFATDDLNIFGLGNDGILLFAVSGPATPTNIVVAARIAETTAIFGGAGGELGDASWSSR